MPSSPISLYWLTTATADDSLCDLSAVLSDEEVARAERFRFPRDRRNYVARRTALRRILSAYLDCSPRAVPISTTPLGRPVLVNARCDVLLGQCLRSNAGLYYETPEDFAGALDAILDNPSLAARLGERGRQYFAEHYRWPVIEQKYLKMFDQLSTTSAACEMEPLPGYVARRRQNCPPALDVLRGLPSGPVRAAAAEGLRP